MLFVIIQPETIMQKLKLKKYLNKQKITHYFLSNIILFEFSEQTRMLNVSKN